MPHRFDTEQESIRTECWQMYEMDVLPFFLQAAAWVDSGRNALLSAQQWRKGRYGHMHQVVKRHFDKNMQKGRASAGSNGYRTSQSSQSTEATFRFV